jgi:methyl-accepting chemotaxis protein
VDGENRKAMANDIQLNDPVSLKNFADDVRKIVSYITTNQQQTETQVALANVLFGQGSTSCHVPSDLSGLVQDSMTQIGGNVQTLIDKLNLIADSADDIAKNYQSVADLDHMSVDVIKNELGS